MATPPTSRDIQFKTNKGAQCYLGIRNQTGGILTSLRDYPWFTLAVKQSDGSWTGIAQEDAEQFNRTKFEPEIRSGPHRIVILKKFMIRVNNAYERHQHFVTDALPT